LLPVDSKYAKSTSQQAPAAVPAAKVH
jgi:hypothetical protein